MAEEKKEIWLNYLALLKKKMVWYGGMATGLVWLLYFLDGFFVVF